MPTKPKAAPKAAKTKTAGKTPVKKTTAKKPVSASASKKKTVASAAKVKTAARKPALKQAGTAKAAAKKSAPKKPAAKKAAANKAAANKAAGLPEQARDIVLRVLDERQAEQIVSIDLRGRSSMADYLIIASGRAARQIAAIADFVQAELAKIGIRRVRAEGTAEGNWVLVDAGDVILHLFRPEVRNFYNIEQIYGEDLPA